MKLFLTFLSVVATASLIEAADYCSSTLCKPDTKHIACGHSGTFATTCPADAALVKIDANAKAALVAIHNEKRNLIAGGGNAKFPRACRMATMKWDDELAKLAALNVMQCAVKHDQCHNTDTLKYSGQNLYWRTFNGVPDKNVLKQAVEVWYGEVKNCARSHIAKYPYNYQGPFIGHFTVMMADRNTHVGCAAATYSVAGSNKKSYLLACNYATTNMRDFPIYKDCPAAASNCKTGKNKAYPNLCSPTEMYDVNKWY